MTVPVRSFFSTDIPFLPFAALDCRHAPVAGSGTDS
jgi:hypothetical protein